jgi:DNA polymerase III delta prime subunit
MMLSDEKPDQLQRTLRLNTDIFLEHLYESRTVEQTLRDQIRKNTDLICFVGPQGAGKTSVATKLIRDLRASKRHLTFIIYIDVRAELAQKAFEVDSVSSLEASFRETIIDHYMDRLFTLGENDLLRRADLWSFLLSEPNATERPYRVFHSFRKMRERGQLLLRKYRQGKEGRGAIQLEEWLRERCLVEPAVEDLVASTEQNIDVAHLAYAARFLSGFDRQILWVDNIDALPEGLQPEVVNILRGFHHLAAAYLSTVVAVREENVFRFNDPEVNAPPHFSRVLLEIPRDKSNRPFYPAVDVPVINFSIMKRIIHRRLVFTRQYQLTSFEAIESRQPTKESLETKVNQLNHTQEREVLVDYLAEVEEEIDSFRPISELKFNALMAVSDALLRTFRREKAVFIANNSLRDLLLIHRDCLAFFLRGPAEVDGQPKALIYPPWYLSTLFLCWIRNTMRSYQIAVYDIIEGLNDWYAGGSRSLGCFLHHLIITCVWNLTLEKKDRSSGLYGSPRVHEVTSRLEKLGFSRDEVIADIHDLAAGKTSLLGIRSKTRLSSSADIDPNMFIYATYRGKCLVSHTSCSFGYLCECLREFDLDGDDVRLLEHPDIRSTEEWATALLPELCDIADMHLAGLERIRSSGALGENWMAIYLQWFGLPQVRTYRRSVNVGRSFGGVRRAFQLESILASLSGYVRRSKIKDKFLHLHKLFLNEITQMVDGEPFRYPPNHKYFRRKLDLPTRVSKTKAPQ